MDFIYSRLKDSKEINSFINGIKNNHPSLLSGVGREYLTTIFRLLFEVEEDTFFAVFPTEADAAKFAIELQNIGLSAKYLPPREKIYYDIKVIDDRTIVERLDVIKAIISERPKVISLSLFTLFDENLSIDFYKKKVLDLNKGDINEPEEIARFLIDSGYNRVSAIEVSGEFSLRGGILDIFPLGEPNIVRVEFFDDEIDTIRLVDIDKRTSIKYLESKKIYPAMELILDDKLRMEIADRIEQSIKGEKSIIGKQKFSKILEAVREGNFENEREILFGFYPEDLKQNTFEWAEDRKIVCFNPKKSNQELESTYEFYDLEFQNLLDNGEVLSINHSENRYFDLNQSIEIRDRSFYISHMDYDVENVQKYAIVIEPLIKYEKKFSDIFQDIEKLEKDGYDIVMSAVDKQKRELILKAAGEVNRSITTKSFKKGAIYLTDEVIDEGFIFRETQIAVFGELNIFGFSEKKARSKTKKTSNLRLDDLSIGDYVIHEEHGVGQYNGVKTLEIKGIKKDYLEILYKDSDKLFVPVQNINLIDKYMSKEGARPKIYRLDSVQWKATKEKNKRAIEQMAKELVDLYAKRIGEIGYSFSKDTDWQREFEGAFEYEETEGQLISADQIKRDMESPHPMDRLLLGDVGYGKTEVAFRAAFKAIMDSKQVAILTPTTLLSEQHTATAIERFKGFPIKIRNISRFRTKKEIKDTLDRLKLGQVDMVIGTHRLLSKDVKFKDLGLLIVDEEQRFGVMHKEKIKALAKGVDVLTLSATPIPRTLSMSLSGIRSLSVIDEPPQNRIPVQTYVTEYNEHIVRSGILKELNRGGQVFFLYNDVKSMEQMKENLVKLVPEARFTIANGQMSERSLEDVFMKFQNKEFDVLITSTIIETGMDVPNVNTLFVYDSEKFGLSTLYQLRGRVGRSTRLAYAYFTYDKNKALSEKAGKRLMAMKEFTDFGSGYKIAMRDLELRGAGNVLGVSQSGHMAEIGYELYMKYLNLAVKELKGEKIEVEINPRIDLEVESDLPGDYLSDINLRMEVYRRISVLQSEYEKDNFIDELIDRYGEVPESLVNLMDVGVIKNLAKKAKIVSIVQNEGMIRIEYKPEMIESFNMQAFLDEMNDVARMDSKLPIIRLQAEGKPIRMVYEFLYTSFNF